MDMDQRDTNTNLPPMTMSVAVPAIPASIRNKNGLAWATRLRIVAIVTFLTGASGFLFLPEELKSLILMPSMLILFVLMLVATHQLEKLVGERDDYERRLQEMAFTLCEKNSNLKQLVQIDPLTQLLNRRGLEKALSVEVSRAQRMELRMFAILLDCDDFKAVNENHGHAGGDLVLQSMATNIFRSIRPTDYVSRIGGDEFIAFLIDMEEDEAGRVAERIRASIAESPAVFNGKALPCTASLGVAELPANVQSIEEVLTLTRQALQSSKTSGKNSVTISGLHGAVISR